MNLNSLDKSADKLIKRYQKTYLYILNRLEYQIENGLNERQSRAILREIQLELQRLDEVAYKWSYEILPQYYYLALTGVDAEIALLKNINVINGSATVIHKKAIEVASNSLYLDLAKNTQFMNESAKKIIRDNSKEILDRAIITGESQRQLKRELRKKLVESGITSFVDAGKKQWKINNYANMAVRTKSRLIHNQGMINRLDEYVERYGDDTFDLIQVSKHGSKCWCGYYEGMVFSRSGRSSEYPALSSLPNFNEGYMSFHPNCKHVLKPYMAELRGKGKVVSNEYLNKDIKEMNKMHYEKTKHSH